MTDGSRTQHLRAVGRAVRSVRGRVAIVATLAVGVVLAAVGAVVVTAFSERELDRVDQRLREVPPPRITRVLLAEELGGGAFGGRPGSPGAEPPLRGSTPGPEPGPRSAPGPGALSAPGRGHPSGPGPDIRSLPAGDFARVTSPRGEVVADAGIPEGLPAVGSPGLRTVDASGERYRVLVDVLPGGRILELGTDLGPVEASIADLRTTVIWLSLIAVAVTALLAWWLAGLAVRPLAALREAVARVSGTRDLATRLSTGHAPAEIDALSESVNAMLARLQHSSADTEAALEATRRFAADVGHELRTPMTALRANLDALVRNPDLDPAERERALAEATAEARRAARLLETLQTLARGDAGATLPREPVDLSNLVAEAAASARRRHPDLDLTVETVPGVTVEGWPDGLRALVDNLLENAARHGRPGGKVVVRLRDYAGVTNAEPVAGGEMQSAWSDGREPQHGGAVESSGPDGREIGSPGGREGDDSGTRRVELRVDDDGPGIPPDDRERVFERFARGDGRVDGTGLGLALVRQQSRMHAGDATITGSPLGGAAIVVVLAVEADTASARPA